MRIVFVHGIFSNCAVFDTLKDAIEKSAPGIHQFLPFNYRYLDPIRMNGERLNDYMNSEIMPGEEVAIIAHSMGGLVSRMALLNGSEKRSYNIRFLFMLATPNHGAMKMSQLHGIAELVRVGLGKVPALYSRSQGLDDLTRVDTIFGDFIGSDGKRAINTKGTDYVTMPATCYNKDHPYQNSSSMDIKGFFLNVLAFMSSHRGRIELELPHDGIVEAESVQMVPLIPIDVNERINYVGANAAKFVGRNANIHIIHKDFRKANHVEIHSIPKVGELIVQLLNSKGIDQWVTTLSEAEQMELVLSNGGSFVPLVTKS